MPSGFSIPVTAVTAVRVIFADDLLIRPTKPAAGL